MKSVYIIQMTHFVPHIPLETPTGIYSVAMVLKLGCQTAFRGVQDNQNLILL